MLQRLTGNPLASPEVLGMSSGAAMGIMALAFLESEPDRSVQITAEALGAGVSLALVLALGRKAALAPERLLLGRVATGAAMSALMAILMATGDPRLVGMLTWLAGSTYQVGAIEAALAGSMAMALLALIPLVARWLDILPLGAATARALGVELAKARLDGLVAAALVGAAIAAVETAEDPSPPAPIRPDPTG